MDLNFSEVTVEKDLSEFSEDELRELIAKFQKAQEANVEEFQRAVEAVEDTDGGVEEFNKSVNELIEEITEHEQFDQVPLSEDELSDLGFLKLRDWREFVADLGESDEADDETEPDDFDDFGTRSPSPDDEPDKEFADEHLSEVQGIALD
jgi:hypothetical protein